MRNIRLKYADMCLNVADSDRELAFLCYNMHCTTCRALYHSECIVYSRTIYYFIQYNILLYITSYMYLYNITYYCVLNFASQPPTITNVNNTRK